MFSSLNCRREVQQPNQARILVSCWWAYSCRNLIVEAKGLEKVCLLRVGASVVFRGLEHKVHREKGSQCEKILEWKKECCKVSWEPGGQSCVGAWRLRGWKPC